MNFAVVCAVIEKGKNKRMRKWNKNGEKKGSLKVEKWEGSEKRN